MPSLDYSKNTLSDKNLRRLMNMDPKDWTPADDKWAKDVGLVKPKSVSKSRS